MCNTLEFFFINSCLTIKHCFAIFSKDFELDKMVINRPQDSNPYDLFEVRKVTPLFISDYPA